MKLTDREQVLVTVLPAVVILGGFLWIAPLFSSGKPIGTLRDECAAAEKNAVRTIDVMTQRARVAKLNREIEGLQKQQQQLKDRVAETCGQMAGARKRIQSVVALTSLLQRHRLAIVEDGPAAQDQKAKLPAAMAEATADLMGESGEKPGQIRCIQFVGRYLDVLAALEELADDSSLGAVPVGLSMSEASAESALRRWKLLVWL